jgi:proline dehydrogenase
MPGERLADALAASGPLVSRGVGTVVTMLGEEVRDAAAAAAVAAHYREAEREIAARPLDVELSVKPTHLGIALAPDAVDAIVVELARAAHARGCVLWIDMEGSRWTDATLALAQRARAQTGGVGVCVQANLRRTEDDLQPLLDADVSVRLVKGAYLEPAAIAFDDKGDVDAAYVRLGRRMIEHASVSQSGARYAFGTHDAAIIATLREAGVGRVAGCEIQMLYGIRQAAQRELAEQRVPHRILISYGAHWFPWYMRRLAERPANAWFLVRSLVAR